MCFKQAISRINGNKMVVETKYIRVVQSLRSSVSLTSTFGSIISNYKQLLQEIADADFVFIIHSTNKVAH